MSQCRHAQNIAGAVSDLPLCLPVTCSARDGGSVVEPVWVEEGGGV